MVLDDSVTARKLVRDTLEKMGLEVVDKEKMASKDLKR